MSLSKTLYHTCFFHGQGCEWWFRWPKPTSCDFRCWTYHLHLYILSIDPYFIKYFLHFHHISHLSSSLCAICSQQVGCHGSSSFSILCHSNAVIWYFCPFLDVIRPHCSRSPPSSSTIYPSFHQQSLYPISSYYMSKILTLSFFLFILLKYWQMLALL